MADNLPEPKSRKESYLAKAAGMDVTIPEAPESRTEQYLAAIAEGGGGGGGTSDFNKLTNRPKYNGTTMTSSTDIPASPTVVQTTGTSETDVMSQKATSGMVFADPTVKEKVQIGKQAVANGNKSVAIGSQANTNNQNQAIAIGSEANSSSHQGVAIGSHARGGYNSVGLGAWAAPSRSGEVNIGTGTQTTSGYNGSNYRVLGGVYDGQTAHDAVTLGQLNTRLDNLTLLKISQTDYDNLQNKDANTLYVITGA